MNEILLDIPTTIPTMAADCITVTNKMNAVWFENAKIIMVVFLLVGLGIGAALGYFYRGKYGSQ